MYIYFAVFNALFKAFKAIINMIKVKYWFCIFTSSLAKVFFFKEADRLLLAKENGIYVGLFLNKTLL